MQQYQVSSFFRSLPALLLLIVASLVAIWAFYDCIKMENGPGLLFWIPWFYILVYAFYVTHRENVFFWAAVAFTIGCVLYYY